VTVVVDAAVHHSGYRCYACSIDVTGKYQNDSKQLVSFLEYERVVEHIETIPPGVVFNRVSIWHALGRGYKLNGIVYHVIRDMYVHGLLVCVRKSGHRCLGYEVRRGLDVQREARQDSGDAHDA
jgi:hypothetical protein